ncbi:ATP synthase A chain [Streptococcus sp. DD10]|uniref:F0F1 ATP synthase subunit A n=1 Tax=Streptococcus sp. DD10 TaxID=1777878 RepID=UPI000794817F|nr:F0F1 ATP synthase subunit A [Streptococcus sp. DD10]KXT76364.1 ATP synthase A chain [Streptococcus sp. DD10]
MENAKNPTLNLGPVTFDLTLLVMSVLTVTIVFGFVYWASRKMTLKPNAKQNVLEYIIDFVNGVAKDNLGAQNVKPYSLFLFTIFSFILVSNQLGLMTKLEAGGYNFWTSPTSNMFYDFGLSLIISLFVNIEGIRRQGFGKYLEEYKNPMNILEVLTDFLSLALRLYGNIYAGEIVTGLLVMLFNAGIFWAPIAFGLNMVWTAFSIFIGSLQAYVFTMLTTMYLAKKSGIEA